MSSAIWERSEFTKTKITEHNQTGQSRLEQDILIFSNSPVWETLMTVIDTSTLDFSEPVASASYREIIETIISSLENGTNAMVSHTDNGELWKFAYGSVEVFVLLTGETDDDFLMVWSPVLALPVTDEPGLLRHLLELNWTDTFEASFALANGQVIVTSQRTVAELSPGEVARAITLVADIADDNDERLAAEYNS